VSCVLLALLIVGLLPIFSEMPIWIYVGLVSGSSICFVLGTAMERLIRRRRTTLQANEALRRLVAVQPAALVAVATHDGHICYASPSFKTILGFDPSAVIGKLPFEHVHPADTGELSTHFARICAGGVDQATFRLRHADGTWRWIEAYGTPTIYNGHAALIMLGRDITERQRYQDDLLHLQKLDSFGRVAGSVVHDINNLLTGIGGLASLVLHALPPEHEVRSDLSAIDQAASRASSLARQMLAFAHRSTFAPRTLDLNVLVTELSHLLQRVLGVDIAYHQLLAADLDYIRGDASQLEQVILNLAMNARDAMPHGGTLTIETRNVPVDASTAAGDTEQAAPYVRLVISDTGVGMDRNTLARVFEPFFTTKAPGDGTGLGLSTCAAIIKEHGGVIHIDSTPGRGTIVTVDLPILKQDVTELEP